MKIKPVALLLSLFLPAFPVLSIAQNGVATIAANDKNLRYFGRWDRSDPAVPRSHWGGAYLRTRFTGTSVGLKMQDDQRLAVSIDGEPFRPVDGKAGVTALTAAPLSPGLHSLLVGPSTGGEAKITGLVLDSGTSAKPPAARPIIEFIGDSITWGTGPKEMWNVNWTWLAAEALNCDHTQVAQSARALTTGYGCADEKTGMDRQYFRLKNFGYATETPPVAWDFATYTPQIIVINLGQNDACGNEPDDVFTASYIQFIKKIRAKFPKAQIVALRMFGGGRFGMDTQKAVAAVSAGGDSRVHFITTEGWLEKPDYSDGVHPNDAGNLKAAMRLAPLLKPLLAIAQNLKTVGDPATPNALAQTLQNAYIRGERQIAITPGTYFLSRRGQAQIVLDHWRDVIVSAYKVRLILDNASGAGKLFLLDNCRNVTLEGPVIVAQNAYAFYAIGESVRISNDRGFYLQANVSALKDNGDGSSTLTLETTETIPLNAKLSNPLYDGHGYKIIGCRLGNTRSRGIIVKSDDGLIKDNVITRCGLALRIGPEWPDEADYCHNVTVTGNTISDNGEGIVVDGSGVKENRDITITNNRLKANTGGDIRIAWADGVTITGNTITAPAALPPGAKPKPPIETRDSTNVHSNGNVIKNVAAYSNALFYALVNLSGLRLWPAPTGK